jgi:hypothetical protein
VASIRLADQYRRFGETCSLRLQSSSKCPYYIPQCNTQCNTHCNTQCNTECRTQFKTQFKTQYPIKDRYFVHDGLFYRKCQVALYDTMGGFQFFFSELYRLTYIVFYTPDKTLNIFPTYSKWQIGQDSSVGIATRYGLDSLGIESQYETRLSAPIQTGPGDCHGYRVFPGDKAAGAWR